MVNSYHGGNTSNMDNSSALQMSTSLIENIKKSDQMSQSLDPQILNNNFKNITTNDLSAKLNHSSNQYPLNAASKMMPVPESLMSPDCGPSVIQSKIAATVNSLSKLNAGRKAVSTTTTTSMSPKAVVRNNNMHPVKKSSSPVVSPRKMHSRLSNQRQADSAALSSDDDGDQVNLDKLKTIRNKVAQK